MKLCGNLSRRYIWGTIFCVCLFGTSLWAQAPGKVDFQRDVQPIFKSQCISCHGPSQQKNGFRLDRRRDAMRGGTIPVIGPGNSAGSRLYMRLIGTDFGLQMPLTGSLDSKQIEIIKAWIDQGAEWPENLSGETTPPPPDAVASKIMTAPRNNELPVFQSLLRRYPGSINRKGPGGATPLMYAALYGDADSLRQLLKSGADPNSKNAVGASALMWAVDDFEKTRLLIEAGADVNAKSDDGRTPLIVAVGKFGSSPIVKLLLDHGANPAVKIPGPNGDSTALSEAAYVADYDVLKLLIERGASLKGAGPFPMALAAFSLCDQCLDLLAKVATPADLNAALFFSSPPFADPRAAKLLLDHGADSKALDPEGRSILMIMASSATLPSSTVKDLIDRGADVNVKSAKGDTALDLARRHGQTPVVEMLIKSGAREGGPAREWFAKPAPASSVRAALARSIPLLQRADVSFLQKAGCVSCHNNTLTAMTVATARQRGFQVDDQIARKQLKNISSYIDDWSERVLLGFGIPGDSDTLSYILLGLAAENHPADAATDALARFLKSKQTADGRWLIFAHRPPLESSDFQVTAVSLRALQVYAPKARHSEYEKAIQLAARWLTRAEPKTTEDRAFQILGLTWADKMSSANMTMAQRANGVKNMNPHTGGSGDLVMLQTTRQLLAEQRADGGWSQMPSLASDAYATGQTLVALKQARALLASDATAKSVLSAIDSAYDRGTQFLLNSQLADGSWYVKSRALPIQPFFESGFPHGRDQFVSAAATNWATMALALASQP
jgi:ankyrin repeat protein